MIILLFSNTGLADGEKINSITSNWYLKNTSQIEAVLVRGSDFEAVPVVSTLCEIWKYRDGSIGAEVSPSIALAFIHRPNLTFAWFKREPAQFDAWVEELPYVLLTDYTGKQNQELAKLKLELLTSLKNYLNEKHGDTSETRKLISKLEATGIRTIN